MMYVREGGYVFKGTVSRDGFGFWWHVWLVLVLHRGALPRFEPGSSITAGRRANHCAKPHPYWATPRPKLSNVTPRIEQRLTPLSNATPQLSNATSQLSKPRPTEQRHTPLSNATPRTEQRHTPLVGGGGGDGARFPHFKFWIFHQVIFGKLFFI
jgi:hypothetical protein